MRRWNWAIAVMVVALLVITAALMVGRSTAQEDDWAAYLTNPATGEWLKVGADGTTQPLDFRLMVGQVAINDTGTRMAVCEMQSDIATLTLYDLATQNELISVEFKDAVGCHLSPHAFSPDGAQVWVGISGDPQANQPAWKLVRVQLNAVPPLLNLESTSPLASLVEAAGGPMMPYVVAADNQQVVFGVGPYGIGGAASFPAYRWNGVDELLPIDDWGRYGAAGLLATDELVWPDLDPNLPAVEPDGPIPAYNVVNYRNASGAIIPIFHSPDALISEVAWVNRGRQLAVTLMSPAGEQSWVFVNRDGRTTTLDAGVNGRMVDSRDGFATFSDNKLTRYIGVAAEVVWTGDPAWQLVWVTPSAPAPNLLPFPAFGTLPTLNPTFAPQATLTTFPSATATAGFTNTPTLGSTATPRVTTTVAPSATNTRAPASPTPTASDVSASPTSGIRPPSSRTSTPGVNQSPTNTRVNPTATVAPSLTRTNTPTRPPASATASNTPRPSSTVRPSSTSAPSGASPTSTLRRGSLASPTPNTGPTTGPTTRPASATPRPTNTLAPTNTRTPTFTPSRTLTQTPTRTPTVPLVPSKTPLPTSGGLPTKAPISGPTSTLDTGGGGSLRIRITNNAGTDLCEIYFTPNTESTWGENYLLNGAILADGASMDWVVDPAIYDVKVFDCFSNSLEEYGFDLTAGSLEIEITSSAITGSPLR